jgi:hypothetical protein
MKRGDITVKKHIIVPIIALTFTFTPTLFMLLMFVPSIGLLFAYIFAASFWGIYFHIIGAAIGLVYIVSQIMWGFILKKRQLNFGGLILAIISILVPIVRWTIVIILYRKGSLELFL